MKILLSKYLSQQNIYNSILFGTNQIGYSTPSHYISNVQSWSTECNKTEYKFRQEGYISSDKKCCFQHCSTQNLFNFDSFESFISIEIHLDSHYTNLIFHKSNVGRRNPRKFYFQFFYHNICC